MVFPYDPFCKCGILMYITLDKCPECGRKYPISSGKVKYLIAKYNEKKAKSKSSEPETYHPKSQEKKKRKSMEEDLKERIGY